MTADIAAGHPEWCGQTSTYSDSFPASNALDGRGLDTFSHTAAHEEAGWFIEFPVPQAAWFIEFPVPHRIHAVHLTNRRECGWRLRDITISFYHAGELMHQSPLLNPENEMRSPAELEYACPAVVRASRVVIERVPDPDLSGHSRDLYGEPNFADATVLQLSCVRVIAEVDAADHAAGAGHA